MDFFNKLGDTIVSATQEVVEKGKDMTDAAKLQYEKKTKEDYCRKQFEEIGKKFYEANKDVIPADYMDLFDEVEATNARIEELKLEIANLKGGVTCPKCGAIVSSTASFCSECGAKMAEEAEEEDETEVEEDFFDEEEATEE